MMPFLLWASLTATDPTCGSTVVSGTGPIVSLYDSANTKVADLKVKDNSLAEPLPILKCTATMVLVLYKGQRLRADRYQVVIRETTVITCSGSGGKTEERSSARTMNGIDTVACAPAPKPAAAATSAKPAGKKRK
ncbi:hypothetical protein HZY97_11590 [Sphingomonas sp. R-74633]|uniref:hypothetical protein n=1 Tax=Sphingomonas sp. R-74633 TaxID=2751188 RepID=UPI0015D349D2|nr:hypothetical protein [Sphingomonas sp. R-74633]NYT41404.1 hypothetical protein [Sphingomonas sp. R-74633]